jgi:hypothetical protein
MDAGDRRDKFSDDDGLTYTSAAKNTGLAALSEGRDQVWTPVDCSAKDGARRWMG